MNVGKTLKVRVHREGADARPDAIASNFGSHYMASKGDSHLFSQELERTAFHGRHHELGQRPAQATAAP